MDNILCDGPLSPPNGAGTHKYENLDLKMVTFMNQLTICYIKYSDFLRIPQRGRGEERVTSLVKGKTVKDVLVFWVKKGLILRN